MLNFVNYIKQILNDKEYEDEEEEDRTPNLINISQTANNESNQLYLRPDLSSALIELIKYYKWSEVYYIYNNENGF